MSGREGGITHEDVQKAAKVAVHAQERIARKLRAYPKLVEALEKAEAALLTARMSVPESHYPEMVEAHREVTAALASTKEGR